MGWLSFAFALAAGAFVSVQAGSNSQLKKSLGAPMPAVIINYLAGLTCIALYTLARRAPAAAVFSKAGTVPWWGWMGGVFGALYGVAAVLLASQLGAATLTALVVTGQLVCSVALDHFGWMGFGVHAAGPGRIIGCVMMVAGLSLRAKF